MTREKITLGWKSRTPVAPVEEFVECTVAAAPAHVTEESVAPVNPLELLPPEPLDICLGCWAGWMGRSDRDLGAHTLRYQVATETTDPDAAYRRRDNEIGEATDAMIKSLTTVQRWAIYRKCGMTSVWRFPDSSYIAVHDEACAELVKKLRINIATRILFR